MSVEMVRSNWRRIRSKLLETIDCFHDDDLEFSPAPGLWTVRELMLHIAHEEEIEVNYGIAQDVPDFPSEFNPADYKTIDSVKAVLNEVHERTLAYLQTMDELDLRRTVMAPWQQEFVIGHMLGHTMEHEAHHRGELSLILGLMGREAPDI